MKEEKEAADGTKTVLKDYEEYFSKNNFSKNDKVARLGKEINDVLVKNKLIPKYTPSGISFSLNEGNKSRYRIFIWMVLQKNSIKMEFPNMSWNDYEKHIKSKISNDKLSLPCRQTKNGFDIIISSREEFDKYMSRLIPLVKEYLISSEACPDGSGR